VTEKRPTAAERKFVVKSATGPTEVVVGSGCLGRLEALVAAARPRARRTLLLVDAGVADPRVHGRWAGEWAPDAKTVVVPAGEAGKTREVHAELEDEILAAGLTRDDVVVAVGGGATLDVAGYAAATTRRGIPWAAAPTSVVGQVDACLGGKVAINHGRGKNLLGTFHPPFAAIVDVTTLRTLPSRERIAGLAEVYKCGVVGDATLLALLERRGAVDDEGWWGGAVGRRGHREAGIGRGEQRAAQQRGGEDQSDGTASHGQTSWLEVRTHGRS